VIDSAHDYAYFGTDTDPGMVVKVRLSDLTRVGVLTLTTGEDYLYSAVIDAANGFAYFGTATYPGPDVVVKVRLSDFTRVGALTLTEYSIINVA
jgi:ethanolamine utilization microcompartment shell protein EutS